ncbi:MAG: PAS domain S-box-containing protein [bacterium]|jgi:PAS domain S-box-containing protein
MNRIKSKFSLSQKFVIYSILIHLILISLLLGNSIRLVEHAFGDIKVNKVKELQPFLNQIFSSVLHKDRPDQANTLLKLVFLPQFSSFQKIVIFNRKNKVFASYESGSYIISKNIEFRRIRLPLNYQKQIVGSILLTFSNQEAIKVYQELIFQSLLIGIPGFAITILIFQFIGSYITQNLTKLLEGTKAIAQGNYEDKVLVSSQDEIGTLAVNFNTMISALHERRQQIHESEKKYREIVETANEGFLYLDVNLCICDLNDSLLSMFSVKRTDILGTKIHQFIGKEKEVWLEEYLNDFHLDRQFFQVELKKSDGSILFVQYNPTILYDSEGVYIGSFAFLTDLTLIKKTETKLLDYQARIEGILTAAADAIITVNEEGFIETFNPAAEDMFGYKQIDAIGKNIQIIIPNHNHQNWKDYFLTESNLRSSFDQETLGKNKENVLVPIHVSLGKVYLQNSHLYTMIAKDISDVVDYRKNLEKKVRDRTKELYDSIEREREINRLKSRFVSMASHEFRTPLTAILAAQEILKSYYNRMEPQEIFKELDTISEKVHHMNGLLEGVLTYGKGEEQKVEYQLSVLNLSRFSQQIVLEVRMTYDSSIRIAFSNKTAHEEVLLDKNLLRQILTNLLSNAVKYSPQGLMITFHIKLDEKKENLVFMIKDRGIGMSEKDIEELFDPFHRGNNVGNIPGTGLGMSILKKAVILHGGSIQVESKIAQGSCFWVCLPLKLQESNQNEPSISH